MSQQTNNWPDAVTDESQLDELLSRPPQSVVETFSRMDGDLAIVGAGGKIGPSLTLMALRARAAARTKQNITVISRFSDSSAREMLQEAGANVIPCDLMDERAVDALPEVPNVIYMVGMKFGTTARPDFTWAINAVAPAYFARKFKSSRVVAFSTGCVYDLVGIHSGGSTEDSPLTPLGEYSNSCVARERVLQYFANTYGTTLVLLRLNYAVELRYGVLVDLANQIAAGEPIDLSMGYVNVIWQGDVNAATLRLLEHATNPPSAINITGTQTLAIRDLGEELGRLMGKKVHFRGKESQTALLSNSSRARAILGEPEMPISQVLKWVAQWTLRGGRMLGKPTHFQTRDGKY